MPRQSCHRIWFWAIMMVVGVGCSDIVEEDVSESVVALMSPADSLHSSALTHQFQWMEVDEAFNYRFQLATPDFTNPVLFLADTLLPENALYWTMTPGQWQWRVRAENGASESLFSTRTLFVDSSETLFGQVVLLDAPVDNYVSGNANVQFEWFELDNASTYILEGGLNEDEIVSWNWSGSGLSALVELDEGVHFWRVYAVNSIPSISNFQQRLITIDLTAPSSPVLELPLNNATLLSNLDIAFSWTSGTDALTGVTDSLYIYEDITLGDLVAKGKGDNQAYNYDPSSLTPGNYAWVIRTYDEAKNSSQSAIRTFNIN